MRKINVLDIIWHHVDTLRDYSTGRLSWSDVTTFFGIPLAVSLTGYLLRWGLYVDALNALLAAFAIFAGLLLNLLLLIYTFSSDTLHPSALAKVRIRFVRELHDNIAYAVIVSILIVVVALIAVAQLNIESPRSSEPTGPIFTFLLVYLTVNFVLTLLMVLRRIHTMLREKLEQPPIKKAS